MTDEGELSQRPQNRREWSGPWRSIVLPLGLVAAVVGGLVYLDEGGSRPLVGRIGGESNAIQGTQQFLSPESLGIKLGPAGGPAAKLNEPAPDFALLDLAGNVHRLSDYRGKTVVVNFWASWCKPCRREFPLFVETYEREKDHGLVILGVNVEESPDQVRKFVTDFGATYPILLDKGPVASRYRVSGLPETWFIDADGVARIQIIGEVSKGTLARSLEETGFASQDPR